MIQEAVKDMEKVTVESFSGLLVDFAKEKKADVIVRGLRAITDFEYELQMSQLNNKLNPDVDTVFICKEGKRSILAINTLREAGYPGKMYNLKDGINTWAREVDRTMPQY